MLVAGVLVLKAAYTNSLRPHTLIVYVLLSLQALL